MQFIKQKHSPKKLTLLISAVSFLIFNIVGCGGGGAGENTPEVSVAPPPANSPSMAISANAAPDNYDFAQFINYQLSLDIPQLITTPSESYYVIKVYDIEQNTYLLALQNVPEKIELSVSVPQQITSLTLEIYSADPQFITIQKEIKL